MTPQQQKIGWVSAAAVVMANMIGTGGFTTLGLQAEFLPHAGSIVALWLLGGLLALAGALCYAELGSSLRQSGGEYHYLTQLYHPILGYLAGWVSLTVGFGAGVALAAMGMGTYLAPTLGLHPLVLAVLAILGLTLVHTGSIRQSSKLHNLFTLVKLFFLLALIVPAWWQPPAAPSWESQVPAGFQTDFGALAAGLVLVNYALSGWNAAAYIVEEIDHPAKNLPRALGLGALVVIVLYLLLQIGLLRQVPLLVLAGKVEVGQLAANQLFGPGGAQVFSLGIALLMLSSLSAMIWVGPRVLRAMAKDYGFWHSFDQENPYGVPVRATWLQGILSLALVFSGTFEQLLLYSGFVLQLFSALAVGGVLILRQRGRRNGAFQSPWYPYLPIFYLLISAVMLVYLLIDRPLECLLGMANLALGLGTYWWSRRSRLGARGSAPMPSSRQRWQEAPQSPRD